MVSSLILKGSETNMLTINQRNSLIIAFEEWCDRTEKIENAESAAIFFSQFCDEKLVNSYLKDQEILKTKESNGCFAKHAEESSK